MIGCDNILLKMKSNFGLNPHLRVVIPNPSACYDLPVIDTQTRSFKNILNGNYGQNYNDYSVYHLWLECLYKINLNFQDILIGLERILTTQAKRKLIDIDKIYILGHQCMDGTIKPAGSCFILLSKLIDRCPSCDFEGLIFEKRVKMMQVSYQTLKEQLGCNPIILFTNPKDNEQTQTQPKETVAESSIIVESDKKLQPKIIKLSKVNQSSIPKLTKIQNKGHAYTLAKKYSKSKYIYIRFIVTGTTGIRQSLFQAVLPSIPINMSDVFLYNAESNSKRNLITGLTVVEIEYEALLRKHLKANNRGKFNLDNNIKIDIILTNLNCFYSMLMNFTIMHKCSEVGESQKADDLKQLDSQSKLSRRQRKRQKIYTSAEIQRNVQLISNSTKSKSNSVLVNKTEQNAKSSRKDPIELEAALVLDSEKEDNRNAVVSEHQTKLLTFGNAVLRVCNLPATLTIHQLNLLMGTFTLSEKQIVAVIRPRKNQPDLMDLMIVMKQDNPDKQRILSKDHIKTQHNATLICNESNVRELERFLGKNHKNLHEIENKETLPTNKGIGYNINNGTDLVNVISGINSAKAVNGFEVEKPSSDDQKTIPTKNDDLIKYTLERLKKLGDLTIKVDNLPAKCSMKIFNNLFGTYTITTNQLIAIVKEKERGENVMEMRIVLNSGNLDASRILSRNLTETSYGHYLVCKKTSISELESFLNTNKDKICDMFT